MNGTIMRHTPNSAAPWRRRALAFTAALATTGVLTPLLVGVSALPAAAAPEAQSVSIPAGTNSEYAAALADALLAGSTSGIEILSSTYAGARAASGLFEGFSDVLEFDSGIVLTTGDAAGVGGPASSILGPNTSKQTSTVRGMPGDAGLMALAGSATYDAAILEIEFVSSAPQVALRYVFGSEEYQPDTSGTLRDVFAIWVNGENRALIGDEPVSPNTVNSTHNSDAFVPNYWTADGSPHNIELNGMTTTQTMVATVPVGVPSTLRIAIADTVDWSYDSALMVELNSFVANTPPQAQPDPVVVTLTNPGDQAASVGQNVDLPVTGEADNGAALTYSATGLPDGLTINPDTGRISGTPAAVGTFETTITASAPNANDTSVTFTWNVAAAGGSGGAPGGGSGGGPGGGSGGAPGGGSGNGSGGGTGNGVAAGSSDGPATGTEITASDVSHDVLATTGSTIAWSIVAAIAAALLGGGALLLFLRRRKTAEPVQP